MRYIQKDSLNWSSWCIWSFLPYWVWCILISWWFLWMSVGKAVVLARSCLLTLMNWPLIGGVRSC
jgi:hypothetical protein